MQSTEHSFELSAQELLDPNASVDEPIEFDDLDTVSMPPVPAANETNPMQSAAEIEIEVELDAQDVDSLLGDQDN
jgi:hypothetical protein